MQRFLSMFSRVSLTWKASALTIALSALTVVALVIASQYVMQQNIAQDVIERQEKNLRIAATMMVRAVPGMEVEWTGEGNVARITVPALPEFGNHDLIDQIGRMTGETATLFVWDEESKDFWRRTTNIKKGDGSRAVGTQLGQGGAVYPVVTRGETFLGEAVILGLPYYTIYEPIFDAAGKVVGILYAGVQKDRLAGRLSEMRVATGIAALAAILLAALSGLWGFRRLLRPVPALSAVMEKLAADETDVEVPYTGREDEVGAMARTVQVFRDNAVERARLQSTSEDERRAREERQKRIESLIAGFRGSVADMLQQVGSATGEMEQTAQALSGIADDTNGRASAATSASEEASSNVQTVASAAEELASSIGEINRQVSQASDIVRHASQNTEATNDKVSGLAAAAQKIGDVVSLIQDIAEQTNLLALNATIEAARAGEMGKGFAVVASEVKSLANQTARATEDISAQIAAIQSSTGEIARTMAEVDQYTSAIAASVEEQGAATAEISRNAQEAAAGTQDVAQNVAGVTAAAGETQQTAGQVSAATAQLAAQAARLREEIDTFLNEVAAA